MGSSGSKSEKVLGTAFLDKERYFGLENFGNTCYCNSVLQALYFCVPFRQHCIRYLSRTRERQKEESTKKQAKHEDEHILMCLCDLFVQINGNKKRTGTISPKKFITRLRQENEMFRTLQHQDAHEFLNYLLNKIDELLQKEMEEAEGRRPYKPFYYTRESKKCAASLGSEDGDASQDARPTAGTGWAARSPGKGAHPSQMCDTRPGAPDMDRRTSVPDSSWSKASASETKKSFVHDLFEGVLASETRCLTCETVTSREEAFIDLSVDVEQNVSLHNCLRNFSASELLHQDDKFFCDVCCSLQEAQKCIRIKKAPLVLAIHLKRFKYVEHLERYKKLSYHVPFSMELRLTTVGEEGADALYHLFAVVIHVGSGPSMGHYVCMVKSHDHWLLFDDDIVEHIPESTIRSVFGVSQDFSGVTQTGYLLFYSLNDCATRSDAPVMSPSRVRCAHQL
uniref:Ubiquitin carboxyl-terminal hydrolase n=1 Tax=Eutreptiella gymnastica TaxID=73025 RepID=A0A7S1I6X6_9EUGL|mmetsp:Transcript_135072/g.234185  ORF Transcript_135072/g.234185 Transcript_135072/m.234185 type:complete len:452 (+) Transcript_135072:30-1385(+)